MTSLLWQLCGLIGLLLIGGIIVALILKKIELVIHLSLFKISQSSFVVTYYLTHEINNVPNRTLQGPQLDYFPLVIGVIILCIAILSLFINKFAAKSPNRPIKFRWYWFTLAALIGLIGMTLPLAALYVPVLFGYHRVPLPKMACLIWISSITIASPIFYKASRMNSDAYPNLMRIIVFFVVAYCAMSSMSISRIMTHAVLSTKISYIFWGALITLGLIPPSLVILGIAKDYIPLPVKVSES